MTSPSTTSAVSPVFPGSFDPPQNGHLDIARRALRLFGRLTVAVGVNSTKTPIFSGDERIELLRSSLTADLGEHAGLRVESFEGLLVDYCHRAGHDVVVRGVRGGHDLDYEMPMAITNRSMLPELETVFFATAPEHAFNSSTLVKEILASGGDASAFLPPAVITAWQAKFGSSRESS
jgi:pantetheine-phosphate adenylyltransferase